MHGITKTIQKAHGEAAQSLYDGSVSAFEFHMAGKPSRLNVGDYVYTIYGDELLGRCTITEIIPNGSVNPSSGKPRTLIMVACPGEKLDPPVAKKGHRGTRYYDGAEWPNG